MALVYQVVLVEQQDKISSQFSYFLVWISHDNVETQSFWPGQCWLRNLVKKAVAALIHAVFTGPEISSSTTTPLPTRGYYTD